MQNQEKASSKTLHLFFYQNTTNGLKRSKSCHFLTITRMKLASQVCDIGYWSYYFLATLPASTTVHENKKYDFFFCHGNTKLFCCNPKLTSMCTLIEKFPQENVTFFKKKGWEHWSFRIIMNRLCPPNCQLVL